MPRATVPSLKPRTAKRPCPLPPHARLPKPRVWRPVVQTTIVLFAVATVGLGIKIVLDGI